MLSGEHNDLLEHLIKTIEADRTEGAIIIDGDDVYDNVVAWLETQKIPEPRAGDVWLVKHVEKGWVTIAYRLPTHWVTPAAQRLDDIDIDPYELRYRA